MSALKKSGLLIAVLITFNSILVSAQTYEQEFQQRTSLLINQVAVKYANLRPPGFKNDLNIVPDPEKYNWPQVLARLQKFGINDDTSNARINRFKNNSPFHFTLVGLARIMNQYPSAPQMIANKTTYLTRIFSRTDGYNAFTDEGTDNHNNMARTSGYLAAQNALGNAAFPQAAAKLAESKQWIMNFSRNQYYVGSAEWNSSQYGSYNVIGWLNLFDFATDPEVKAAARAVLDYLSLEIGLHYSQGWTGGSEMRGTGVPAFGVSAGVANNQFGTSSQDYLGWLWFGDLSRAVGTNYWNGNEYIQSVHAAVSSYRPSSYAIQIAKKQIALPAWFKASKGEFFGKSPSFLQQNFYADQGYTIGTAYMPYGGWTGASFAIQSWKLMGRISVVPGDTIKAPQIITGAGRYYDQTKGRGRQPYDQFAQNKNVLIQMTKTPVGANLIDTAVKQIIAIWRTKWQTSFNQRFPGDNKPNPVGKLNGISTRNESYISYPSNATVVRTANVVYIEMENAFVAVRSLANTLPGAPANDGNLTRQMVIDGAPAGSICGFVLEAANKTAGFTFTDFQAAINAKNGLDKSQIEAGKVTYISLQNDTLAVSYNGNGTHKEAIFDWGYGPTTPQTLQNTPPYLQPTTWPTTNGGRVASWSVNGDSVVLDGNWPVYEGPGVSLDGRILRYEKDSVGLTAFYQVDYTATVPVFTSGIVTANRSVQKGQEWQVEIYPNPARSEFTLKLPQNAQPEQIELFSLNGNLVKEFEAKGSNSSYSLKGIRQGLYIIRIRTANKTATTRLLVE